MNTNRDYEIIQEMIFALGCHGAQITNIIEDVQLNYEVASHKNNKMKVYYRDLLSRLIKTYGH